MRVVVDAVPVRGGSLQVVAENLLRAWTDLGDELHVVLRQGANLDLPPSVEVHTVPSESRLRSSRVWASELFLPKLCRGLRAEVALGITPATTARPLPCPKAVIAHDLRYLHRPDQFPIRVRLLRRASYSLGYRRAAAIGCVSERTRNDLLAAYAGLDPGRVRTTRLGADHVLRWPQGKEAAEPYALAFGQWNNKNVDLVLDGWSLLQLRGTAPRLVVVGLSDERRSLVQAKVSALGLSNLVTLRPWLSTNEFQRQFSSASMIVFPSEYEGFGLPAIEAMRLGLALVVTPDPALLEVSGGLATVMEGWSAEDLAVAVTRAAATPPADLRAAQAHAAQFTWRRMAEDLSTLIASAV